LLAGCDVDAKVVITLRGEGWGSIAARATLDAAALAVIEAGGVPVDERVDLSGFEEAGWRIEEWERLPDGGATIRISHGFSGERELALLLADLFGEDGMLAAPDLDRSRGIVRSSDGVTLDADLTDLTAGVVGDAELSSRLQAAGVDPAVVDAQLAQQLDGFGMTVTLIVPRGGQRSFRLGPGDVETLALSTSGTNWGRIMTLGIAALLAFLALLLYLAASISARRRRIAATTRARADAPVY
jgi:hypothetical protein